MEYKTYVYNNKKIHITSGPLSNLRLLQSSYNYLSTIRSEEGSIDSIINCSYFTTSYALGRNQGDMSTSATSSYDEQGYLGVAINKDGSYVAGKLNYWDGTENIIAGFTPATITYLYGEYVELYTNSFGFNSYAAKMSMATSVTMFGILSDKKTALLVAADSGISAYNLVSYLTSTLGYKFDLLCTLDGGGSTEMIVNKTIVKPSTDTGTNERKMFNGLAFIQPKEATVIKKASLPFLERLSWNGITDKYTISNTTPVKTGSKYFYEKSYNRFAQDNLWMPNCTCYAAGRAAEISTLPLGREVPGGNAKTWWTTTTWNKSTTIPKVGAICVWGSPSSTYGHVAIVERINEDGTVVISQSNYTRASAAKMNENYFQTKTVSLQAGKSGTIGIPFLGYIYNPYVNDIRVKKDSKKSQVEVITNKIKARKNPSLSGESYEGLYIPQGIYDILETQVADNYLWIKIYDNVWFASNDEANWTKTNLIDVKEPIVEEKPADDSATLIENLKTEISILQKEKEENLVSIQSLNNNLNDLNNTLNTINNKYNTLLEKLKNIINEVGN